MVCLNLIYLCIILSVQGNSYLRVSSLAFNSMLTDDLLLVPWYAVNIYT